MPIIKDKNLKYKNFLNVYTNIKKNKIYEIHFISKYQKTIIAKLLDIDITEKLLIIRPLKLINGINIRSTIMKINIDEISKIRRTWE